MAAVDTAVYFVLGAVATLMDNILQIPAVSISLWALQGKGGGLAMKPLFSFAVQNLSPYFIVHVLKVQKILALKQTSFSPKMLHDPD